MTRKLHVTIQVSAYMPKTYLKGGEKRLTKKTFSTWVSVGRFPVLYHDKSVILVRQFGSHSLYHADGTMSMAGYHRDHPGAHRIPARHGTWRIHPDSILNMNYSG